MPPAQIALRVDHTGALHLDDEVIAERALTRRLARMVAARPDQTVFFEADDEAPYARAVTALDDARAAGARRIGVLTRPPDLAAAR